MLHAHIIHHLSLTVPNALAPPCQNTHSYLFSFVAPASLSLAHMTNTHTFIPSTVGDIYSDYVGLWRSKIVVIRKLARHLSLQQPIKQPAPPTANGKNYTQKWFPPVCVCVNFCTSIPTRTDFRSIYSVQSKISSIFSLTDITNVKFLVLN